jgi:ketosteroid isomerase-like protein
MTTTLANKEIALGFFDAVLTRDIDRATSMLADDCEFYFSGDLPFSGRHDALSGIGVWSAVTASVAGTVTFDFGTVTAEEDRVAIEAESRGSTGELTFNNQYHFLFRFRDGKISQVKEYFDTLHVWELVEPMFADSPRSERKTNLDSITSSVTVNA